MYNQSIFVIHVLTAYQWQKSQAKMIWCAHTTNTINTQKSLLWALLQRNAKDHKTNAAVRTNYVFAPVLAVFSCSPRYLLSAHTALPLGTQWAEPATAVVSLNGIG